MTKNQKLFSNKKQIKVKYKNNIYIKKLKTKNETFRKKYVLFKNMNKNMECFGNIYGKQARQDEQSRESY